MIEMGILTLGFAISMTLFILGYLYGRYETEMPHIPNIPFLKPEVTKKDNVNTNVTSPSGTIERPDATTINKWNEDGKVKDEKDALSETFTNDPDLIQAKKDFELMQEL